MVPTTEVSMTNYDGVILRKLQGVGMPMQLRVLPNGSILGRYLHSGDEYVLDRKFLERNIKDGQWVVVPTITRITGTVESVEPGMIVFRGDDGVEYRMKIKQEVAMSYIVVDEWGGETEVFTTKGQAERFIAERAEAGNPDHIRVFRGAEVSFERQSAVTIAD